VTEILHELRGRYRGYGFDGRLGRLGRVHEYVCVANRSCWYFAAYEGQYEYIVTYKYITLHRGFLGITVGFSDVGKRAM
jgi:hypothetical protein